MTTPTPRTPYFIRLHYREADDDRIVNIDRTTTIALNNPSLNITEAMIRRARKWNIYARAEIEYLLLAIYLTLRVIYFR